jgi:hypothetical protein
MWIYRSRFEKYFSTNLYIFFIKNQYKPNFDEANIIDLAWFNLYVRSDFTYDTSWFGVLGSIFYRRTTMHVLILTMLELSEKIYQSLYGSTQRTSPQLDIQCNSRLANEQESSGMRYGVSFWFLRYQAMQLRPRLVHLKNLKLFKIFRHIESCGIYMKH